MRWFASVEEGGGEGGGSQRGVEVAVLVLEDGVGAEGVGQLEPRGGGQTLARLLRLSLCLQHPYY